MIHPSQDITIVQVESLTRLADEPFELLILDEYQSLFEQLNSKLHKNPSQLHYKFIQLLRQAKRILVLDAQLQPNSLEHLQYYADREARLVVNEHTPYADTKFIIHPIQRKNDLDAMLELMNARLADGKNVYSHINSKKRLFVSTDYLQKQGHLARNYHGDNLLKDGETIHSKVKQEHFKAVEKHFKNYSCVLANSAMGAGVDFSEEHFDTGIHAFFPNTSSPMLFVQAIFRARHFREKEHHIFLEVAERKPINSTAERYAKFKKQNDVLQNQSLKITEKAFNLTIDLEAYCDAMACNRANIIISGLKQLGCKVEVDLSHSTASKLYDQIEKALPPLKMHPDYFRDLQLSPVAIDYFLADDNKKLYMQTADLPANIKHQQEAIWLVVANNQIDTACS